MNGLTSRQAWTHEHIARCSCGSWMVVTDRQLHALNNDIHPTCPHITPAAMEAS